MHSIVLALLLAFSLARSSGAQQMPNGSEFQSALKVLSSSLWELFDEATGYEELIEWYNSSVSEERTTFRVGNRSAVLNRQPRVPINGSFVLQNTFEVFGQNSDDFRMALQNLTDASVELYSAHYNSSCCSDVCLKESTSYNLSACWMVCNATEVTNSYFRTAYNGGNLPPLEYSPVFDRDVNFSHSAVHIPVYVYEQKPSVLCFVEWSSNLTEEFQEQWKFLTDSNHIITFMYIGSEQSAAIRIYPAAERIVSKSCDRCPFDIVDTYDAKSRPWYVDTISGDKDVVLLLDMSGSMLGIRSDLARLAAIQLLNSLSDQDYFHVLRVDDQVSPLGGCFTSRVRASVDNKLAMARIISRTVDSYGVADFSTALDMAQSELMNSSSCRKIIVVFTDYHSSLPDNGFSEMSNDTDMRVFAFVVGTTNKVTQIEEFTCKNRGAAFYINGYSNIIRGIQDFFSFFNQAEGQSTALFTGIYGNEFLGGLVITVSQPVIAQMPDSSTKFVGVIAIDLKAEGPEFIANSFLLGPLGYVFGFARSGDLLFHPLIDTDTVRYHAGLIVFDVYYYEFVEPQEQFANIRRTFLSGAQGQTTAISAIPVEGRVRYVVSNFTYSFTTAVNTTLVIVVKLPTSGVYVLRGLPLNADHLHELMGNLSSFPGEILVSIHKLYCSDWHEYSTNDDTSARNALQRILEEADSMTETNTSSAECFPRLYEPLLFDLYATSHVVHHWEDMISHNDSTVVSVFAQYTSGLTWCLSESLPCLPIYNINFVAMAEANGFDNTSVFRGLSESGLEGVNILIRPIKLPFTPFPSVGVLGIVLETEQFDQILVESIANSSVPESSVVLLDTSGYLVGSNFGLADEFFSISELFTDLLNEKLFVARTVVGYDIRICSAQENESLSESSGSAVTGFLIVLTSFSWHLLVMLTSVIVQFLASFPFLIMSSSAMDAESTITDNCTELGIVFCVSQVYYYSSRPEPIPLEEHTFSCNGSEMEYQVSSVPETSMVAVRILGPSQQLEKCSNNGVTHGEEEYVLPCLCENQLYRSSPDMPCPVSTTNYSTLADICFTSGSRKTEISVLLVAPTFIIGHLLSLLLL